MAAADAFYPCLLEQLPDKFYCTVEGWLGWDYAGYYFCNDSFNAYTMACLW